jgi:uncharacterized protein (TIGR03435 family)
MPRMRALAIFAVLASALAPAQSRRGPAPDGSDNDIHLIGTSLKDFIGRAYHLVRQQIAGPAWLDEVRVDLVDHVPPGTTPDQIPHLLQIILAQRFKLAFHRESRKMTMFLLEVAKGGAKMDQTPAWDKRAPVCEPVPSGLRACHATSMPDLAWLLQNEWPGIAPIYDRTGLSGPYDFDLDSLSRFTLGVQRDSPIKFKVQSMQDQLKSLGLTIEQQKGPVEILIVDHCEKKAVEN